MVTSAKLLKKKSWAGKRYLKEHGPKIVENDKNCVFLNGKNASGICQDFFRSMRKYKASTAQYLKYGKKNCGFPSDGQRQGKDMFLPFEDINEVQHVCQKYDASLFGVATHNKKRPHNIVLGRMYNHQLLDMFEFGITDYKSLNDFMNAKVTCDTKPILIFKGSEFIESDTHKYLKSFLTDFFIGPSAKNINLSGFELTIVFISCNDKIMVRFYRNKMPKRGGETPVCTAEEIGPSLDLVLRRSQLADNDLLRLACKVPPQTKAKKKKNISRTALGDTLGRVHMQKQDLGTLQVRKTKAISKAKHDKLAKRSQAKALARAAKQAEANAKQVDV